MALCQIYKLQKPILIMGALARRTKLNYLDRNIEKLAIVAFLVTLSASLIDTIWAVYLEGFLKNEAYVGFFSGALTFISLISFFLIIPLIEKKRKDLLFFYSGIATILTYVLFSISKNFVIIALISIASIIAVNIRITSFGIIIKDKSKRKNLSANEGVLYTLYDIGWFVGPLIAGYVAAKFGFSFVFLLSALILFIAMSIFSYFHIRDKNIKKHIDANPLKNFFDFFRDKKRIIAYFLGGGVNFWWILIYLFIPLYIFDQGLGIKTISIFLVIVTIPNLLFTYKFSSIAGKVGFKKMFIIGYSILAISALICFFISDIYFMMLILTFATLGIAMVEPTSEAYFLDLMKGKEVYKYYSPYNTTIDVNGFFAKIIPAIALLFLDFKFIFLIFAVFMLAFIVLSLFTKNIIESRRKN